MQAIDNTDPVIAQAKMQSMVDLYMTAWSETFTMMFKLIQEYLGDEELQRIAGMSPGLPPSLRRRSSSFLVLPPYLQATTKGKHGWGASTRAFFHTFRVSSSNPHACRRRSCCASFLLAYCARCFAPCTAHDWEASSSLLG